MGDKNRYIRVEWDFRRCNHMVGGSKGINCGGKYADYTFIHTSINISIINIQNKIMEIYNFLLDVENSRSGQERALSSESKENLVDVGKILNTSNRNQNNIKTHLRVLTCI